MTYKEIVSILLSGCVSVENCGIRHIEETDSLKEIFPMAAPCDRDSMPTGDYFYIWTNEEDYDGDLERCLACTEDEDPSYTIFEYSQRIILFKIV